ncbi:MAG: SDR family oxidoreductase [Acidimicrobiaceae bacterium]|nr:SDR family oxidoreductase [Acidimicrobiaceae bacterium]
MSQPLFNRVLVTGGAGYVGSALVPRLLAEGYSVTILDLFVYCDVNLPYEDPDLRVVTGDIRDQELVREMLQGQDAVVHLACISNDPSFELDPSLSKTINFDPFEPMVANAKAAGVKRFVYCSSSSVYGVSELEDVTEETPLDPLTLYSQYKAECEPILLSSQSAEFEVVILRPATVCGYAPRCRLDLTVNILTNHAVNNRNITVFGGSQLRPNLHIDDMCDVYLLLLASPAEKIQGQTFNAGEQNLSVDSIASLVKKVVEREFPGDPVGIDHSDTNDLRSYHINSDKIASALGWRPRRTVETAVFDLCNAFRDELLPNSLDDDRYFNVRVLQSKAN